MLLNTVEYSDFDFEAIKILEDFVPDKVADAHAHLFDTRFLPTAHNHPKDVVADFNTYQKCMMPILCNPKELRLNVIPFPEATMRDASSGNLKKSDEFVASLIEKNPENVYEIIVLPNETAEQIEKRLTSPRIRGLKCYYFLSDKPNSAQLPIGDYLPESAWEVAKKHKLCITLHLVKSKALADEENLSYIKEMTKRYPDVVLILAHAARSFASWTAFETVEKICHTENIMYDFSSICETPAMFQILKKVGVDRCMWGSDFPVSLMRGRPISVADGFYWLGESEKENIPNQWIVGCENLLAVRQTCMMLDFSKTQIEKLFWGTAANLWGF
ncbi:MAG: amidohydrolase family protein [Clostridia bacterium]|nr:amidohydrolase family protein [Clostridia bacterium]